MTLSKCCTQQVSKSGKPSSGHRTGKGQCKFPRRAVLKNVQTTGQLHLSPMLVRLGSKSCTVGFTITRTENFQMSKLGLEKAEEPEIKLSTFAGSQKKQECSRKNICFTDYTKAFVWITTTVESSERDGNTRPPYLRS